MTPSLRKIARQALYDALSGPLTTFLVIWTIYAVLLLCTRAWGGPADSQGIGSPVTVSGPAVVGAGAPATTTTSTTTTTTLPLVTVPAAGNADANCPTTIPVMNASQSSVFGYANLSQTCPTGANAGGYNVTAIAIFISTGTAGKHVSCSVYDSLGPPRTKVAAGCDSVPMAFGGTTPNAYQVMATSGTCHLAASTRYWIACFVDDAATGFGIQNPPACTGCFAWVSQAYGAWPATLTPAGSYNETMAAYLTVQ